MASLSELFRIGASILRTVRNDKTGAVLAQLGDSATDTVETDNAEIWGAGNFVYRPAEAQSKGASCDAVAIRHPSHDVIIATRDMRGLELAGTLRAGETCVYAPGKDGKAQGRVLLKDDGSVTHYTTQSNLSDGESVYFRVAKGVDDETKAPDGFSWVAPWGTMKFDDTGFHIAHQSGATFDLGGITGLPPPCDIFGSYVKISAATFNAETTNTSLGAGAPVPLPNVAALVALNTALQAQLAALQVQTVALTVWAAAVTNLAATLPVFPAFAAAMAGPGNAVAVTCGIGAGSFAQAFGGVAPAMTLLPQTSTSST